MTPTPSLRIPAVLDVRYGPVAIELLNRYFGTQHETSGPEATPPYTGASFETLGHNWDDADTRNVVTAADLLALTTLSVRGSATASIEILNSPLAETITEHLEKVPGDIDLVHANSDLIDDNSDGTKLWKALRQLPQFGPTTTSKLLARKRSRLFPIYDTVVGVEYGLEDSQGIWAGMRAALQANDDALHRHAMDLRLNAGLPEFVSPLRVIDVVTWMYGKNKRSAASIAADHDLDPAPLLHDTRRDS